jgi:DNA-binding NtrC family response regulator
MEASLIRDRLSLLLTACQQANAAGDPRPILGLVTREVAALAALLEPPQIVGESNALRKVRQTIEHIRASSASVLITGEPGAGKELAAAVIHQTSLRARSPLMRIDCARLDRARTGKNLGDLFRRARGGAVLLKDVCDLSTTAQSEILRALDDPETDVRFLAATARALEVETARGTFRRDLYYRLRVIHIALPSLKDIPEDIPLLVRHFLDRFCAEFGREPAEFSGPVLDRLQKRPWPGNTGQLEAGIRLLVRGSLRQATERLEKQMLLEALSAAGNNQSHAARNLGLSRQGLINKRKKYGLTNVSF